MSRSSAVDLPGRTVAVNTLNNIGDVTIKAVLQSEGIDPNGVSFTELAFPDMPAAVEQKRVDAAWACGPFVTQMLDRGNRPILDNYAKTDRTCPLHPTSPPGSGRSSTRTS